MTHETLTFFDQLLGQVSLPANAPDFEEKAAMLIRVRRDLAQALADQPKVDSKNT